MAPNVRSLPSVRSVAWVRSLALVPPKVEMKSSWRAIDCSSNCMWCRLRVSSPSWTLIYVSATADTRSRSQLSYVTASFGMSPHAFAALTASLSSGSGAEEAGV